MAKGESCLRMENILKLLLTNQLYYAVFQRVNMRKNSEKALTSGHLIREKIDLVLSDSEIVH